MVDLCVVIPTTHKCQAVDQLARHLLRTSPVTTTVVVVDNGPGASGGGWATDEYQLVFRPEYLGSEQAFVLGLKVAPHAGRYLLMDHDASIDERFLEVLLSAATDPAAVYSANQNGDGSSWDRRNGRAPAPRDCTPRVVRVDFAPWSGLLLSERAAEIVRAQNSGLFFFWDDYLLCHVLRREGITIWGVPGAAIGNDNYANDFPSAWRTYYRARNHILFQRETGFGGRFELILVRGKEILMLLGRRGRFPRVYANLRGIVDGICGRRGGRMLPDDSWRVPGKDGSGARSGVLRGT